MEVTIASNPVSVPTTEELSSLQITENLIKLELDEMLVEMRVMGKHIDEQQKETARLKQETHVLLHALKARWVHVGKNS